MRNHFTLDFSGLGFVKTDTNDEPNILVLKLLEFSNSCSACVKSTEKFEQAYKSINRAYKGLKTKG